MLCSKHLGKLFDVRNIKADLSFLLLTLRTKQVLENLNESWVTLRGNTSKMMGGKRTSVVEDSPLRNREAAGTVVTEPIPCNLSRRGSGHFTGKVLYAGPERENLNVYSALPQRKGNHKIEMKWQLRTSEEPFSGATYRCCRFGSGWIDLF